MPREQLSIKLLPETIARVEDAARLLELSRSAFIERAVVRALDNLDAIVDEMERDSPFTAALLDSIASNKQVATTLMRALAKEVPPQHVEDGLAAYPRLRDEATRRKKSKRKERGE